MKCVTCSATMNAEEITYYGNECDSCVADNLFPTPDQEGSSMENVPAQTPAPHQWSSASQAYFDRLKDESGTIDLSTAILDTGTETHDLMTVGSSYEMINIDSSGPVQVTDNRPYQIDLSNVKPESDFKSYQLSLHKNYVSHWGLKEAVRELLQNALDNLKDGENLDYEFSGLHLHLRSHGARLDPAHLLLGNTTKADDQKAIGSFGEGFKLALLVLTRLGHQVVVHNGERMWIPEFEWSELYQCEVLAITETLVGENDRPLEFEVRGLSEEQQLEIQSQCLHMQEVYRQEIIKSTLGEILTNDAQKGKLYIGGLYVCETKMWHGYNFNPDQMAVERDRQTVDGMDLKFATKNMWFGTTGQEDLIAQLISDDCPDLEYAEYGTPEPVVKKVFDIYEGSYGARPVARNQVESDLIVERTSSYSDRREVSVRPVVLPSAAAAIVQKSTQYKERTYEHVPTKTPNELMIEFIQEHDTGVRRMNEKSRKALRQLVLQSRHWKNS